METLRSKSPDGSHPVKVALGNPKAASRKDAAALHPWVLKRWTKTLAEYIKAYPKEPKPFLTTTFRNRADQEAAFKAGNTQVHWGGSLHNLMPSIAFDIAFEKVGFARLDLFTKFAQIAKKNGLEWGGDWTGGFKDRPHFQVPNFYDTDIASGRQPKFYEGSQV